MLYKYKIIYQLMYYKCNFEILSKKGKDAKDQRVICSLKSLYMRASVK